MALDVGRVEPGVGHRGAAEGPPAQLLDVRVQARGDGAHLVLGEPGDAHLLGDSLHLACAGARGVNLVHGGDEGAVERYQCVDYALVVDVAERAFASN